MISGEALPRMRNRVWLSGRSTETRSTWNSSGISCTSSRTTRLVKLPNINSGFCSRRRSGSDSRSKNVDFLMFTELPCQGGFSTLPWTQQGSYRRALKSRFQSNEVIPSLYHGSIIPCIIRVAVRYFKVVFLFRNCMSVSINNFSKYEFGRGTTNQPF